MLLKNPQMDGSHVPKARERIRELQEGLRKWEEFVLTVYEDDGGNVQVHAGPEGDMEKIIKRYLLTDRCILFQFRIEGKITEEIKVTNY